MAPTLEVRERLSEEVPAGGRVFKTERDAGGAKDVFAHHLRRVTRNTPPDRRSPVAPSLP